MIDDYDKFKMLLAFFVWRMAQNWDMKVDAQIGHKPTSVEDFPMSKRKNIPTGAADASKPWNAIPRFRSYMLNRWNGAVDIDSQDYIDAFRRWYPEKVEGVGPFACETFDDLFSGHVIDRVFAKSSCFNTSASTWMAWGWGAVRPYEFINPYDDNGEAVDWGRDAKSLIVDCSVFEKDPAKDLTDADAMCELKERFDVDKLDLWSPAHANDELRHLADLLANLAARYQTIISTRQNALAEPREWLLFGAPGTGKSHLLNKHVHGDDGLPENTERVTFYADYLHSQFVGSYKPSVIRDGDHRGEITYSFRPGPFTRVLVKALNDPSQNYVLIIEELNRAEAASVFGDLFQLLDRDSLGVSEYSVTVSEDMREYLQDHLTIMGRIVLRQLIRKATDRAGARRLVDLTERGRDADDCSRIVLPPNMYIWATMNSADQGVFPLDTAFKRRWDFEYVGINHDEDKLADREWNRIRKRINALLLGAEINEDKLLGPFFLGDAKLTRLSKPKVVTGDGNGEAADAPDSMRPVKNEAFARAMKNKVIMYLFEDAARYARGQVFDYDAIRRAGLALTDSDVTLKVLFDAWDSLGYAIFVGVDDKVRGDIGDAGADAVMTADGPTEG